MVYVTNFFGDCAILINGYGRFFIALCDRVAEALAVFAKPLLE